MLRFEIESHERTLSGTGKKSSGPPILVHCTLFRLNAFILFSHECETFFSHSTSYRIQPGVDIQGISAFTIDFFFSQSEALKCLSRCLTDSPSFTIHVSLSVFLFVLRFPTKTIATKVDAHETTRKKNSIGNCVASKQFSVIRYIFFRTFFSFFFFHLSIFPDYVVGERNSTNCIKLHDIA